VPPKKKKKKEKEKERKRIFQDMVVSESSRHARPHSK
jgi:hypothetical protein